MSRSVKPEIPEEPEEIKKFIINLVNGGIPPAYAIWLGNKLPKYLWRFLGGSLKTRGLRWQDFLKCISRFEGDVSKWVVGEVSWEELMDEILSKCYIREAGTGRKGLFKWLTRGLKPKAK